MKCKFNESYISYFMDEEEIIYTTYEGELLSITDGFWNGKQAHILCDDGKVRSKKLSEITFIK